MEARLVPSISLLTLPLHGTLNPGHHAPHVQSLCVRAGPAWASVHTCALNTGLLTPQVHGRHQGSDVSPKHTRSCTDLWVASLGSSRVSHTAGVGIWG